MKKTIAILLSVCCLFSTLPMYGCAYEVDNNFTVSTEVVTATSDADKTQYVLIESPEEYAALSGDSGDIVYYGKDLIDPDEIILLPSSIITVSDNADSRTARSTYTRIEFPGTKPNAIYSDFSYHPVSAGASVTMTINTCVWAPEHYDLEIGIYNWTDATNRWSLESGGSASFEKTFTNLTAGEYSIYIRNRGSSALTTGYLKYRLS